MLNKSPFAMFLWLSALGALVVAAIAWWHGDIQAFLRSARRRAARLVCNSQQTQALAFLCRNVTQIVTDNFRQCRCYSLS